jgi:hypothetical protein
MKTTLMMSLLVAQVGTATSESMPIDASMAQEGVSAEFLILGESDDAEHFARSLIAEEGLSSWNGAGPMEMKAPNGLNLIAVTAGDGRTVVSVYGRARGGGRPAVCRLRASTNGAGDAAWRAHRWCAEKLGVTLPVTRQPPIH